MPALDIAPFNPASPTMKLILDLCGGTGSWSEPYRSRGYTVLIVDPQSEQPNAFNCTVEDFYDGLLCGTLSIPAVHGVLSAPPCTEFASSGAWAWERKDREGRFLSAVAVVRACLGIVSELRPIFWALENPIGRIQQLVPELGAPRLVFDPCDYGDPWTKRTCLWGTFHNPKPNPVQPESLNEILHQSPSENRQRERSKTPPCFAAAFCKANP